MSDKAINAYQATDRLAASASNNADVAELVQEYGILVRRIALHLLARLPDHIDVDDLIQAGMVGLLEAAGKFDDSRGASFSTYAGIRIRGAMVDEIRRGDWAPRSVHKNTRLISQAMHRVSAQLGRAAQDKEVADELGVELDQYYKMRNDTNGSKLVSYDLLMGEDGQPEAPQAGDVASAFEAEEVQEHIAQAITALSEREQLVLSLYYDEMLNLKEIGLVLGVGESRVSQIMSKATLQLRSLLADDKMTDAVPSSGRAST